MYAIYFMHIHVYEETVLDCLRQTEINDEELRDKKISGIERIQRYQETDELNDKGCSVNLFVALKFKPFPFG